MHFVKWLCVFIGKLWHIYYKKNGQSKTRQGEATQHKAVSRQEGARWVWKMLYQIIFACHILYGSNRYKVCDKTWWYNPLIRGNTLKRTAMSKNSTSNLISRITCSTSIFSLRSRSVGWIHKTPYAALWVNGTTDYIFDKFRTEYTQQVFIHSSKSLPVCTQLLWPNLQYEENEME